MCWLFSRPTGQRGTAVDPDLGVGQTHLPVNLPVK